MLADANLKTALRRFAISTTLLNIAGYVYLGFEPAYAMPIVAVLAALATQLLLEWCRAYTLDEVPLFARGGLQSQVDFLLPAYIIGLTCSMFVYTAELYWPLVFAVVLAIASKQLFRVPTRNGSIHFINPATLGITATVLLFPHIGIGLPWMFSTNTGTAGDIALPVIILGVGTLMNLNFSRRMGVVVEFVAGVVVQGLVRAAFFDARFLPTLILATGPMALLFTFFMAPEPVTTPRTLRNQHIFGLSVGLSYGLFVVFHLTHALFFALIAVCVIRGILIWRDALVHRSQARAEVPLEAPVPALVES